MSALPGPRGTSTGDRGGGGGGSWIGRRVSCGLGKARGRRLAGP